jgi:ABC-type multidrug transport system fused ATPase/permease subunit
MESCAVPKNSINFSINIAVHVFILFAFLSAFFIFYVSHLAKTTFEDELQSIIKQNMTDSINKLSVAERDYLRGAIQSMPIDTLQRLYSQPSAEVDTFNQWLFKVIIMLNIFMFLIISVAVIMLYTSCDQCVPIKHILIDNAVIFSLIGAVEYLFFTRVAIKYIPVMPSVMITSFFDSLSKQL